MMLPKVKNKKYKIVNFKIIEKNIIANQSIDCTNLSYEHKKLLLALASGMTPFRVKKELCSTNEKYISFHHDLYNFFGVSNRFDCLKIALNSNVIKSYEKVIYDEKPEMTPEQIKSIREHLINFYEPPTTILIPKEREILLYLSNGYTSKDLLKLSLYNFTIYSLKYHLSNIYKKLDVKNCTQALVKATIYSII